MNPQELDEHIEKLKKDHNDMLENNSRALNSIKIKSAIPRQLTWKEIKQKYAHVIQRSQELNGTINN